MESPGSDLSTFERSCQHWAESGQAGMNAFYRLASVDYRLLAEEIDWPKAFEELRKESDETIQLLDVACGSGQFPDALLRYSGLPDDPSLRIDYSLLDPSEFSIRTAKGKLKPPFYPASEFCCSAQQFDSAGQSFSVVWATHALYCVPPAELELAISQVLANCDGPKLGFVAHASRDSHYLRFHNLFVDEVCPHLERYSSGEQVVKCLQSLTGEEPLAWRIEYEGKLPLDDRETAQLYLQRCLFDESLTLEEMLAHPQLGPYLESCTDRSANQWRFPQKVWLIFFGSEKSIIQRLRCKPEN